MAFEKPYKKWLRFDRTIEAGLSKRGGVELLSNLPFIQINQKSRTTFLPIAKKRFYGVQLK